MNDTDRYKLLHGPYKALRFRYGRTLFCEMRGDVVVHGMSPGRIAWPATRMKNGRLTIILCGGLVKAVRREAGIAVAYWWGGIGHRIRVASRKKRLSGPGAPSRRLSLGVRSSAA